MTKSQRLRNAKSWTSNHASRFTFRVSRLLLTDKGDHNGRGQGQGATIEFDGSGPEAFNQGTYGRSETETAQGRGPFGGAFGGGVFGANGTSDGHGRSSGADQGRNETTRTIEWETLIGEVTAVDSEITVQTAEGKVAVGLGQASYRESFALEVGDEVSVTGFYEDGEFKAGTVENLTTGETLTLWEEETGHPMWAGCGRLKNQGQP